jgi:hypothetical protein
MVSSPRFVGRQSELNRLEDLLAAGSARTVLVGGEAGIGKTRLLGEFAGRLTDVRVLVGCCTDVEESGLPYAPFVHALRSLHDDLPAAERETLFAPGRTELARLLPELGEPSQTALSASGQARLFELLLGLLKRLSAANPLVLVLEDLHWADHSTRSLVGYLARNLAREPVLILASYRSDELARGHPLRALIGELARTRTVEAMGLQRFTHTEVAEQIGAILATAPHPALVDAVYARSEGNAFYVEELLGRRGTRRRRRTAAIAARHRHGTRRAASAGRAGGPGGDRHWRPPGERAAAGGRLADERERPTRGAAGRGRRPAPGRGAVRRLRVPPRAGPGGDLPGAAAAGAHPAAPRLRRRAEREPGSRRRAGARGRRVGAALAGRPRRAAGAGGRGAGGRAGRRGLRVRGGERPLRACPRDVAAGATRRGARGGRAHRPVAAGRGGREPGR